MTYCTVVHMRNGAEQRRCVREIGHPGLHRYFVYYETATEPYVQEFPDSQAVFPACPYGPKMATEVAP